MSKVPNYPRAAPFQDPSAVVDEAVGARLSALHQREAQLRRWMFTVAAGTVVIVMLTVSLGVYLVIQAVQLRPARIALANPLEATRPAESPRPQATPERSGPPTPPPTREASAGRAPALEAVGALSGSHLYQTYLNIGLLADAAENDVYGDAEAIRLLSSILQRMDHVEGQLTRLAATDLAAADQQRLAQVRQLSGLLRNQARALRTYWDAPENDTTARKECEKKFHDARTAAWTGIKELLDLRDE